MKNRDSMVFYRSFYDAVKLLPNDTQLEIFRAIFEFGLDGVEPELSISAKPFWLLIKPNLQSNRNKWENGCKAKRKQNTSKTEAKGKQSTSKHEANVDVDVDEDVDDNTPPKPPLKGGNKKREKKQFAPPTYEEVLAYFSEKGQDTTQARKAFNHYNDHDWKDSYGKQVLNWKQKVQTNWFKDLATPEFIRSIKMPKDQGDAQMHRLLQKGLDVVSGEELEWIYDWQHRTNYTYLEYPDDIRVVGKTTRKTKAQCMEENRSAGYGNY